jgi:hypothetical protein
MKCLDLRAVEHDQVFQRERHVRHYDSGRAAHHHALVQVIRRIARRDRLREIVEIDVDRHGIDRNARDDVVIRIGVADRRGQRQCLTGGRERDRRCRLIDVCRSDSDGVDRIGNARHCELHRRHGDVVRGPDLHLHGHRHRCRVDGLLDRTEPRSLRHRRIVHADVYDLRAAGGDVVVVVPRRDGNRDICVDVLRRHRDIAGRKHPRAISPRRHERARAPGGDRPVVERERHFRRPCLQVFDHGQDLILLADVEASVGNR